MSEHENTGAQDRAIHIGETLKKAREELGQSLKDVEEATKIRARYLEAMENDDFDALPGAVYARGFLKTYANYLDLDGERFSQELVNRQAAASQSPDDDRHGRDLAEEAYTTELIWSGTGWLGRIRNSGLSRLVVAGGVMGALLLVIVVGGLYLVGLQASQPPDGADGPRSVGGEPLSKQDSASQGTGASGTNSAKQNDASKNERGGEGGNGAAAEEPPPADQPSQESLTMDLLVNGDISWLNIEVDGIVVLEQIAQSGFSRTFEAEESITVWTGNAGVVFISLNGEDAQRFGEFGETKTETFTLEDVRN